MALTGKIHTTSIGDFLLPVKQMNIKFYGADEAIKTANLDGSLDAVTCWFRTLQGSALVLPDLAKKYPNISFVIFVMDSKREFVRNYVSRLPRNVMLLLANVNKDKYGIMKVSGKGRVNSVTYDSNRSDYYEARFEALNEFYKKEFGKTNVLSFGFAFDNPIFRICIVNYFMEKLKDYDFENSEIYIVAGSGLMSVLLCKALNRLGVSDTVVNLMCVGMNVNTEMHKNYCSYIVRHTSSYRYMEQFDYETVGERITQGLAELGSEFCYDTYDGKLLEALSDVMSHNGKKPLMVFVRNGY